MEHIQNTSMLQMKHMHIIYTMTKISICNCANDHTTTLIRTHVYCPICTSAHLVFCFQSLYYFENEKLNIEEAMHIVCFKCLSIRPSPAISQKPVQSYS